MARAQGHQSEPADMIDGRPRFYELSDIDADEPTDTYNMDIKLPAWLQPDYLQTRTDALLTETSTSQQTTEEGCLQYLQLTNVEGLPQNRYGLPHLNRELHIQFLHKVFNKMPSQYQVIDASRPWLFYWVLQGLTILGEDVSQYRERLVSTLRPLQNRNGGFAGGYGQNSHSATTYGCILALAMVDGLDMVDRDSMWRFLGRVKQSDGGFRVAVMAEEDIRGAYCAMTIITLLNLPIELPDDAPARKNGLTKFTDGLGEWIGRCQTYEGGIAGAPSNEAHGAYAFCALACLSIIDHPSRSITKYLDVQALLTWLVNIQTSPEGGFAGRTNKLVDSCYSHWVGGCWALLQAALPQASQKTSLWNREALIRYLLTCCQQPGNKGGMRDKPSARPDAYHTCYALAGLSAAVNHYTLGDPASSDSPSLPTSFAWTALPATQDELSQWQVEAQDVVNPVHPVFVIPFEAVRRARERFVGVSAPSNIS